MSCSGLFFIFTCTMICEKHDLMFVKSDKLQQISKILCLVFMSEPSSTHLGDECCLHRGGIDVSGCMSQGWRQRRWSVSVVPLQDRKALNIQSDVCCCCCSTAHPSASVGGTVSNGFPGGPPPPPPTPTPSPSLSAFWDVASQSLLSIDTKILISQQNGGCHNLSPRSPVWCSRASRLLTRGLTHLPRPLQRQHAGQVFLESFLDTNLLMSITRLPRALARECANHTASTHDKAPSPHEAACVRKRLTRLVRPRVVGHLQHQQLAALEALPDGVDAGDGGTLEPHGHQRLPQLLVAVVLEGDLPFGTGRDPGDDYRRRPE